MANRRRDALQLHASDPIWSSLAKFSEREFTDLLKELGEKVQSVVGRDEYASHGPFRVWWCGGELLVDVEGGDEGIPATPVLRLACVPRGKQIHSEGLAWRLRHGPPPDGTVDGRLDASLSPEEWLVCSVMLS